MGTDDAIPNRLQETTNGLNNVFLASTEYFNELPQISYNLKTFLYPYNLKKYSEYMTPQFAKTYVNDEFIGCDNVLDIDFLDMDKYEQKTDKTLLEPEDLQLLIDSSEGSNQKSRTQNHTKSVSWLRKTEYISAETVRNTKMSDLIDKKLIQNAEQYQKCTDSYKTVSSQIDAINTTFDDSKIDPCIHAKKPQNVKPIDIFPILPIDDLPSASKCAHIIFDTHPTLYGTHQLIDSSDSENAILRGLSDQDGEYVGYYIPNKIALPQAANCNNNNLKQENPNIISKQYRLLREYNWNVISGASQSLNDIYVFTENSCNHTFEYMAVPTRIKLVKRHFSSYRFNEESNPMRHSTLVVEQEVLTSPSNTISNITTDTILNTSSNNTSDTTYNNNNNNNNNSVHSP